MGTNNSTNMLACNFQTIKEWDIDRTLIKTFANKFKK